MERITDNFGKHLLGVLEQNYIKRFSGDFSLIKEVVIEKWIERSERHNVERANEAISEMILSYYMDFERAYKYQTILRSYEKLTTKRSFVSRIKKIA